MEVVLKTYTMYNVEGDSLQQFTHGCHQCQELLQHTSETTEPLEE